MQYKQYPHSEFSWLVSGINASLTNTTCITQIFLVCYKQILKIPELDFMFIYRRHSGRFHVPRKFGKLPLVAVNN